MVYDAQAVQKTFLVDVHSKYFCPVSQSKSCLIIDSKYLRTEMNPNTEQGGNCAQADNTENFLGRCAHKYFLPISPQSKICLMLIHRVIHCTLDYCIVTPVPHAMQLCRVFNHIKQCQWHILLNAILHLSTHLLWNCRSLVDTSWSNLRLPNKLTFVTSLPPFSQHPWKFSPICLWFHPLGSVNPQLLHFVGQVHSNFQGGYHFEKTFPVRGVILQTVRVWKNTAVRGVNTQHTPLWLHLLKSALFWVHHQCICSCNHRAWTCMADFSTVADVVL